MTNSDSRFDRLTTAEMREYDRLAIHELGLPGVVLMENAGAGAASIALTLLAPHVGARVLVACGPGQNGGDGWVVARRLVNAGCEVHVATTVGIEALRGDSAVHAHIAIAMGIAHEVVDESAHARWRRELVHADLVVDALLGTGAQGLPRGAVRLTIEAIVARTAEPRAPRILALDLPSGLDADTGRRLGVCVRADATATFAAPKTGFDGPGALEHLGTVHVVDLGVPPALLDRVRRGGT